MKGGIIIFKRKLGAVLTAVVLCGTMAGSLSASAAETKLYGDLNGDNQIRADDAVYILFYYAGKLSNSMEQFNKNCPNADMTDADYNKDGEINTDDAMLAIRFYAMAMLWPSSGEETYGALFEYYVNERLAGTELFNGGRVTLEQLAYLQDLAAAAK